MSATLTDYRAIWDYEAQPRQSEAFPGHCNLCDRQPRRVYVERDRYGYSAMVADCYCGLVYLNPRMTAAAYREFYASGAYRRLVSAYHGREINERTIQPEQAVYGYRLGGQLFPWIRPEYRTVLDVGGSTGVVAAEAIKAMAFALEPSILDPAPREMAAGPAAHWIASTIEDFDPAGRTWDVILLCQTVDHLLAPMGALRKIRAMLAPGGVFWVDALDYDRTRTIKIDHPYNFTERTLRMLVEKAGFEVIAESRDVSADGNHVGFVCRKPA